MRWGLLGIVVQEEAMDLRFVDNEGLRVSSFLYVSLFPW